MHFAIWNQMTNRFLSKQFSSRAEAEAHMRETGMIVHLNKKYHIINFG
jgi:hypothetical protein